MTKGPLHKQGFSLCLYLKKKKKEDNPYSQKH